jgi:hypothetical protein
VAAEANAAADTVAEGVDLGGKSSLPGYRKSAADPQKETSARRGTRRVEETALLRKALNQKKEETTGGAEAQTEASQAFRVVRFQTEAGIQQQSHTQPTGINGNKTVKNSRGSDIRANAVRLERQSPPRESEWTFFVRIFRGIKKRGPEIIRALKKLEQSENYSFTTLDALGPLGESTTSNCTDWPSANDLKPLS